MASGSMVEVQHAMRAGQPGTQPLPRNTPVLYQNVKRRMTQTTSRDTPVTLVFWYRRCRL